MKPFPQRSLTMAAVIGMAYWLFGNLYESIVFSPNWVRDSPAQFTRLNEFFTVTGPTLYFIPITPIALLLVWILWWRNRDGELAHDYRRAGQASILLAALTTYIVAATISKMFGPEALSLHAAEHPCVVRGSEPTTAGCRQLFRKLMRLT